MKCTEYQMSGQSGLESNVRSLLISDITYQKYIMILTKRHSQGILKTQALLWVHGNLSDSQDLKPHEILNCENVILS